jgi:hypothetical protein
MIAKDREVHQDVAVDVLADQETETARRVEPLDPAGNDKRRAGGIVHRLLSSAPLVILQGQ